MRDGTRGTDQGDNLFIGQHPQIGFSPPDAQPGPGSGLILTERGMQSFLLKGFDPSNDQFQIIRGGLTQRAGSRPRSNYLSQLKEPLAGTQVSPFASQDGPGLGKMV